MKVLLSAYECCPNRGSEAGRSWNWAWHLSTHHEVRVLTISRYRDEVEAYLAKHPNDNLRFVWVDVPRYLYPWDRAKGGKKIPLHYIHWLNYTYREAKVLHARHSFDVAHHVSYNGLIPPPILYRLPIPFVWGPVGGGMTAPDAFLGYFGREQWKEALRTYRVRLSRYLPSVRRAVRETSLLFAINHETARFLRDAGTREVPLFLDAGPAQEFLAPHPEKNQTKKDFTLMWAGWLIPRKALPLGLDALARVRHLPVRLVVVGKGPLKKQWQKQAADLGLADRVEFLGQIPWTEMAKQYRKSDAFLFTSLRDSSGNVVFEAMANALPILTLDHQGVGAHVPPEAGIKVPVTTPTETVTGLAEGIEYLVTRPDERMRMGQAAWVFTKTQSWERRAKVMSTYYEELVGREDAT